VFYSSAVLIANFNKFFLKILEVLKLVQKTKLNSAEARTNAGKENEGFIEDLQDVDFNNRSEESKYK